MHGCTGHERDALSRSRSGSVEDKIKEFEASVIPENNNPVPVRLNHVCSIEPKL